LKLGSIIRTLRLERGFTLKELAERARLSVSFLNDIEKGRSKPSLETLINISRVLQTTPAVLLNEDCMQVAEEDKESWYGSKVVRVPVFRETSLNKSYDEMVFSKDNASSYEMVVMEKEENEEKLFFLYSPEDSMSISRIHKGDLVLIKKADLLEDGEIGAFWLPEQGVIIRRYFQYESIMILQADSSHYRPVVIYPHSDYRVIGKAVKVLSKIK